VKDLTALLSPKTVAVIGASRSPEKVGAIVLKNIIDSKFPGKLYPVNPNVSDINGLTCYSDVNSLPEVVDLAIVALPVNLVSQTLNQIGEKGIKNVLIYTAGYKEIGPEGQKLEDEMLEIAGKYSLQILGPNCLGFVNNNCPINATFGQPSQKTGNLRFISQSGAIAASLFDWCNSTSLGFSDFITLGNKTVLNENDFLEFFHDTNPKSDTPHTCHPIGLYLESISKGSEFIRIAQKISLTDPVFIIKPGKTKEAASAMKSHTGSIAGEDSILEAALSQAGIIRAQTMEDFFDLSRAFAWENAPTGPRVAIISNAGGPAVISADAVVASGLELAQFDTDTKTKLQEVLPRSAGILNPVDVLGDALADRYAKAAEIILSTNLADSLLVILTPQVMTQVKKTAQAITDLSKKYAKPIFCCFIGGQLVSEGEQILNQNQIPSFRFPERAISTIGAMWQWKKRQLQPVELQAPSQFSPAPDSDRIKEIVKGALSSAHPSLNNLEANEVVSLLGIPTPATRQVDSVEGAREFAGQIGWPIVLKLSSPGLLHKATVGGVVTNIWDGTQLELAWERLNHNITLIPDSSRADLKFQVQKDVSTGIEVIVGLKHDPTFGPVLLFGAGGQLAELVADRNLKILPVSREQVKKLVEGSKVRKLLQNHPGEPEYPLEKLYDLIVNFTQLIPLVPEATDIEINPVIITHNDVWAVDTKIVLGGLVPRPAVIPSAFHTAAVLSNNVLAAKFRLLEFESEQPLVYKAGQYISIKVAPNRINSYSIASQTDERKFQLLVDTSPGGPGSKFFENVKPGDKVAYLGPFGIFTYKPDDGAKRLLFFGTGSGCSPLRSILEAAIKHPAVEDSIDFYFGLRHTSDVFWQDYFQKLQQEHPNFHYKISLSQPDETWQGAVGHVTELLEKEIPDASQCAAYLCGNPKMMEEATKILIAHNCPKERIYSEAF
jgi:acetyltransferase